MQIGRNYLMLFLLVTLFTYKSVLCVDAKANTKNLYGEGSIGVSSSAKGSFPGNGLAFGGSLGTKLSQSNIYLGIFLFFETFRSKRIDQDIFQTEEAMAFLGPEITFRNLLNSGLYLGAKAGIGSRTLFKGTFQFVFGSAGFLSGMAGPVIGYDFKIGSDASIGISLSYLLTSGGSINGTSVLSAFNFEDEQLAVLALNFKEMF